MMDSFPKPDNRLTQFLLSLSATEWRGLPRGVGLKTANEAMRYGLIEAQGNLKDRTHRLTPEGEALAREIKKRVPVQSPLSNPPANETERTGDQDLRELEDRVALLESEAEALTKALRLAQSSQFVHEMLIVHLCSHIAELADDRGPYLAEILAGVEASLMLQVEATRKQYEELADASIADTLDYFARLKAMMLGTVVVPVQGTKN